MIQDARSATIATVKNLPALAFAASVVLGMSCAATAPQSPPPVPSGIVVPVRYTDAVGQDADDPAIWLHATDPARSLILGTNKVAVEGSLVTFTPEGRTVQIVAGIDRPNNVDVEYGVRIGAQIADIAVVTERLRHRLLIFRIPPDGRRIENISAGGGMTVLAGQTGEAAQPMGIALYKRPSDGVVFAIVAPKTGESSGYLWQYRLEDDGNARIRGRFVRRFGHFSRRGAVPGDIGEIEAVAVDDELGFVYYADERFGIRKWHADPDHPNAGTELAVFGTDGYELDREGLAIYVMPGGRGYIVSTDQIPNGTEFRLYPREGAPGRPHNHPVARVVRTTVDSTDGIEVVSRPLPGFPAGMLVAMNGSARNFAMFRWEDIIGQTKP